MADMLRLEVHNSPERRARAGSHGTPTLKTTETIKDLETRDFETKLFSLITSSAQLESAVKYRHVMMDMMKSYTDRLKLTDAIKRLNIVHVAGTKGKGSTCAFVDSILRSHGLKTGFFSSPHLVDVTERFRICGVPITRETMLRSFFFVWDSLHSSKDSAGPYPPVPSFFRFLTLVGFKIFLDANVDVVILEVGMGGRLDATNIITPIVCGITPLDLDHTRVLGDTIEQIAYEKAGIIKPNVPCFTSTCQDPEGLEVIKEVAKKVGSRLRIVEPLGHDSKLVLGLKGGHQKENAALAMALSNTFLEHHLRKKRKSCPGMDDEGVLDVPDLAVLPAPDDSKISPNTIRGLLECVWPGRTHTIDMPSDTWGKPGSSSVVFHLDGAHTRKSMECCIKWFNEEILMVNKSSKTTIVSALVFNCSHDRKCNLMFERLQHECEFNRVFLTPADYERPNNSKYSSPQSLLKEIGIEVNDDEGRELPKDELPESTHHCRWQHIMGKVWDSIRARSERKNASAEIMPSVSDTINTLQKFAAELPENTVLHVLFTGSLFMVGSALNSIGWKPRSGLSFQVENGGMKLI